MYESIWSNPALVSIPAALAVILISGMFLKHLAKLGQSRDEERSASLAAMVKIGSDFANSLQELNSSRLVEQAQQFEFYRIQSLCMQKIISKCGGSEIIDKPPPKKK